MDLTCRTEDGCSVYTAARGSEVLGYVAIHSTVAGRSCGGLRMLPDVSEGEICGLARVMTLKYGLLGLPQGGAKAGVRGDPDAPQPQRRGRLVEFAQAITPLVRARAFVPCADMGTDAADIRHVLAAAGVRVRRRQLRADSSGYYTAVSVQAGAVQSARHMGLDLRRCTVAIEGFGKVGVPLCELLAEQGANVVAISTSRGAIYNPRGLDTTRLVQLAGEVGSRVVETYPQADRIDRSALLELPVDLLCPCGRGGSISDRNAMRIVARIICAGANNPVTPEAQDLLAARGILCLPDFVTNCGGVLGGTMEFASIGRRKIAHFIGRYLGASIAAMLEQSARSGVPARAIADSIALSRFKTIKRRAEHPNLPGRLFALGLALYGHGLLPSVLTEPLAEGYFRRLLAPLLKERARP